MRWPETCPACLLGGSQLLGRVEVKPQGDSSQRQIPGTLFTHARRDNLSHHPPRQASHKKTPANPGFLTRQGCYTRFQHQRGICQRKRVSLAMRWGGSTQHLVKSRAEECACASGGTLFPVCSCARRSFPQRVFELFSSSKPGQVWHEWAGCFQGHTYLTETCVQATSGKCQ